MIDTSLSAKVPACTLAESILALKTQELKFPVPPGPGGPGEPLSPLVPFFPGGPIGPSAPWGPGGPDGPCFPSLRLKPRVPSAPCGPGGPGGPRAPGFPDTPLLPFCWRFPVKWRNRLSQSYECIADSTKSSFGIGNWALGIYFFVVTQTHYCVVLYAWMPYAQSPMTNCQSNLYRIRYLQFAKRF